ncbi:citrate lyase beta subunit [Salinarchaeum sp. Harcht-Bsk1]|uniref:HpcH/HpaI aldolase/citrate lyase family protein n=1 Tax=Salinarchaeum sp. Harcht-Bsk1 TaxID=1333523 RepID=UPI000342299E|nr:CoA ester lyase [Salinarchaeum sp. Harcht-Bsk1]AGN00256.1 citrate lyase beta subunit [Salinarchaeum sp. Harcht-Bsk1]
MPRRSVLFTPGDRREMLVGAADSDADALVFDLEDGVAPARKSEARETVRSVLADDAFAPDAECFVRVNPIEFERGSGPNGQGAVREDLREIAAAADAIDGIVLPKTSDAGDVRRLGGLLRTHGLPRSILALVETAAGVQEAPGIASAGGTTGLVLGTEDLAADVGASPSADRTESRYARQRVVTAAAAAGVDAIDTLWTDFEDEAGLRDDAADAVRLGFDGKLAIHPAQVGPINEAFTPDETQRDWADRVLAAREEAGDRGAFAVDGEMIDAPLLARAERIAERARAAGFDSVGAATEE